MKEIYDNKGRVVNIHSPGDGFTGFVDSQMQRNLRGEDSFSVRQIIKDPSILERFSPKELPEFQETNTGVFFSPYGRSVNTVGQEIIKWFSLTKDLEFRSDHSYQYATLDEEGYLMKISVPRMSDRILSFDIKYITSVNDIRVISISENLMKRTIDEADDLTGENKLRIVPFEPEKYPEFSIKIKTHYNDFIQKYLNDLLKV